MFFSPFPCYEWLIDKPSTHNWAPAGTLPRTLSHTHTQSHTAVVPSLSTTPQAQRTSHTHTRAHTTTLRLTTLHWHWHRTPYPAPGYWTTAVPILFQRPHRSHRRRRRRRSSPPLATRRTPLSPVSGLLRLLLHAHPLLAAVAPPHLPFWSVVGFLICFCTGLLRVLSFRLASLRTAPRRPAPRRHRITPGTHPSDRVVTSLRSSLLRCLLPDLGTKVPRLASNIPRGTRPSAPAGHQARR